MPHLKAEDYDRLRQTTLASLRESFNQQTPQQRQQTLARIQALLDRERQRENVGARSYLWKYARPIYGVNPE